MSTKYAFYFQNNNILFDDNILVVVYTADRQEVKKYHLTGENIILLLKSKTLNNYMQSEDINYFEIIKNSFNNNILLRIQSECIFGSFGDSHCDCESQKKEFINILKGNDGIFIHMPQEAQGWGLGYKCNELELQFNGRDPNGKYLGIKTRDEAQKILKQTNNFVDNRNYEIIAKIFSDLGLIKKTFILYTESEKKVKDLLKNNIKVLMYDNYMKNTITSDNVSEYLIKILNSSHKYSKNILNCINNVFIARKYNERSLETLIEIINKIKNDKKYIIDDYTKTILINTYNEIICGVEKNYILKYSAINKSQNKLSCLVNPLIFKLLINVYHRNIFNRLCFEKNYYFLNKKTLDVVKIRNSKVLDIRDNNTPFMIGQLYSVERTSYHNSNIIEEDTTSLSRLRTMFENPEYDYVKRQEMITYISENDIDGLSIYIKRIPSKLNWVLDIYGHKNAIHSFVDKLATNKNTSVSTFINNIKLEEDNYSDYNLRFCDLELAVNEELENYNNIKKEVEQK